MPTLAMNMTLPGEKSRSKTDARKNAPQPKSGGKDAPKTKRKYIKKSDYWKKKKKK